MVEEQFDPTTLQPPEPADMSAIVQFHTPTAGQHEAWRVALAGGDIKAAMRKVAAEQTKKVEK